MIAEKILFVTALLGSVLYLFDRIVGAYAHQAEKKKAKLQAEKEEFLKARAEAQEKAKLEQAKAAQSAIVQLVETVHAMQAAIAGVSGVLPEPASTAPVGAVAPAGQEASSPTSATSSVPGENMTLEQKVSFLASAVMAQSEQMEAIQATLRQITEAGGSPKRRVARKGADETGISQAASKAAKAVGNHSMTAGAREEPPLDGLDSQPPHEDQRQGDFEIVK